MKKIILITFSLAVIFITIPNTLVGSPTPLYPIEKGKYNVIIEGFDWGPAVNKVIIPLDEVQTSIDKNDYTISAIRSSRCFPKNAGELSGARTVSFAYVSDAEGNRLEEGGHATFVMMVGPDLRISSPMQYFYNDNCIGTQWVDYQLIVINTPTNQRWDEESKRIMPLVDDFDLTGSYVHSDKLTMSYATYQPETEKDKLPLLIWLHGGGEGGSDLTLPLIANKAANYASEEIQSIFGGAHVLVPQCPGAWMHNEKGVSTRGKEDDIYNEGLMALIKDYVQSNPRIDRTRIYLGGCSNGGYMSLKLLDLFPDYFAGSFISALAYHSEFLSDAQVSRLSKQPIWFMHAANDGTTLPEKTVLPIYKRLQAAGAKDVHLSYYDYVVDITGFFGGENYYYNGHLSWIYGHENKCRKDFDGGPVLIDGREVTIMEWLATKSN